MMKAPNLPISDDAYAAAVEEHAVNKRFWDNPKSIAKYLNIESGSFITVAPPINPYYELNSGISNPKPVAKTEEAINSEKISILAKPSPIVAFGSRIKENFNLEDNVVYYALLKSGMESHKVFYINNVRLASFDEFAILALVPVEQLPKFSLQFKATPKPEVEKPEIAKL